MGRGLGDFWRLTNGATFGSLWIHRQGQIRPTSVVDSLGEPIDDRNWLSIGSVDEQALVMDADSGTVMIYWYLYFKHRWDSGVVFECADIPELIDTVALGPKYPLTFGPPERQKSPWWERDSWYLYLCEIGLIHR